MLISEWPTSRLKVSSIRAGTPIISPYTGEPTRSRINMPDGIHYIFAEMGNGNTVARAGIELDLKDSYGQFNVLHVNQDGMIR